MEANLSVSRIQDEKIALRDLSLFVPHVGTDKKYLFGVFVLLLNLVDYTHFIGTILTEYKPEIWWKIKCKLRTRLSLNFVVKCVSGKRCRSFPLTNEQEKSFPC